MNVLSIITLKNCNEQYAAMRASLRESSDCPSLEFLPVDADAAGMRAAEALNVGLDAAGG